MNDKDMGLSLDASALLGFRDLVQTDAGAKLGRLHSKVSVGETPPPRTLGRLYSKIGGGEQPGF